jgi:hypothetical protein
MVTLAQFHQHGSEQWSLFEVERRPRHLTSDSYRFSLPFEFWDISQVYEGQSEASFSGMNDLHRLAFMQFESGSPDFIAPDHFSQGPFERDQIQWACTANGQGFVVNRNFRRSYLAVKPNLLLGERQRRRVSPRTRSNVRLALSRAHHTPTQVLLEQSALRVR